MPLTRSQTRKKTLSNGKEDSIAGNSRTPRGKTSSVAKRRRTPHAQTTTSVIKVSRSSKRDGSEVSVMLKNGKKILWRLTKELIPFSKIILRPFRKSHSLPVVVIILILLITYPVRNWLIENLENSISHLVTFPDQVVGEKVLIPAPRHLWVRRSKEIKNCISQLDSLTIPQKGREIHLYITGGPGSGKSELARQVGLFLYETGKSDCKTTDVLTFEAETVDTLLHSFIEAITLLSKKEHEHAGTKELKDSISQIRDELNLQRDLFQGLNEGDVLTAVKKIKMLFVKLKELLKRRKTRPVLIFDNVQDLKVLYQYVRLEPGREDSVALTVLVTVQKRVSLPRLSTSVAVMDLYDGMSQEDAVDLLNVITGLDGDFLESANELADLLGRQPLALVAAAIYIESVRQGPPKRSDYTYFDYLSEFKKDMEMLGREEQVEWEESMGSNYLEAMHVAILKAANRTAQIDPVLRDIACAVGFADTGSVSLSFIQDYLKNNPHRKHLDAQVRNTLRNCVLFKIGGSEGDEQLASHQISRKAFRDICKVSCSNVDCLNKTSCDITPDTNLKSKAEFGRDMFKETLSRVVTAFQKQIYYGNSSDVELSKNVSNMISFSTNNSFGYQFLDVLSSLCVHSTKEEVDVAEIMNTGFLKSFLRVFAYGYGYWSSLLKPAANEHKLKKLLELTTYKSKGPRYALQTMLLVLCVHNGATKSAKEILVKSLDHASSQIVDTARGGVNDQASGDRSLPVVLNILGVIYRGLGYPYYSRTLHQVALRAYQDSKGDNNMKLHLEKATTLHKLGVVNRYLGNLTRAEECHLTSLKLLEDLYGLHHPSIAASLLNLAVVYSRQPSKTLEALKLYNRSLVIMTNIFGPRHPHVGRVLNTIGTVYYRLGEFDTAIDNSERALQILDQFHGAYHPHVAEALTFLGFMYRDKGNLIKSREVLERSLQIKDRIFDPDHFILGETMNDLGVVYTRLGEGHKAKVILKRALGIFKRTWGLRHSAVATTTNSLAAAHLLMGETKLAKALHEEALNIFVETDGTKSHSVAETKNLLGNTYKTMGEVAKAKEMYQEAYVQFRNLYGTKHWRVKDLVTKLSSFQAQHIKITGVSCTVQVI